MYTIHKYEVQVKDEVFISMPEGAEILHVDSQLPGRICFWAKVKVTPVIEPGKCEYAPVYYKLVNRKFVICGTGQPLPMPLTYIGTVMDAPFVWHVFEKKN
jgi:hypothetical protein